MRIRIGPALKRRRASEIREAPVPRSPLWACNAIAGRSSTTFPVSCLLLIKIVSYAVVKRFFMD
jgi:hypothetical protein